MPSSTPPDPDPVEIELDATERRAYERELLTSRTRMERLHRIALRIDLSLDPEELAHAALDELVDGVTVRGAALVAVFDDETCPALLAVRTETPELAEQWKSLAIDDVPWLVDALQSATPVFIDDLTERDEATPTLTVPQEPARLAVLPLIAAGRQIGLLCVASPAATPCSPDEQTFLLTLAASCARSLDRTRLHQQMAEASRRSAFLSSISRALFDEALLVADRAELIVDRLVPEYADFAIIDQLDDADGPITARHRDPSLVDAVIALRRARVARNGPGTVARGRPVGQPVVITEMTDDVVSELEFEGEELRLVRQVAPTSFVGIPLLARGREVGVLILGSTTSERRFRMDQLPFFVDLADRVALALENARLHELERGLARRLQTSLLPAAQVDDPRVHLTSRYRAATETMEIGGDWRDAFLVNDHTIGVAVGDVVGHDESAALAMGQLSTALRAFALEGEGPRVTVDRLSRFATAVPGGTFATVTYAEIDLERGSVTHASAGHMPPILQQPDGWSQPLWEGRMPPLGTDPPEPCTEATETFSEGAALLLFTDGLVESRSVPFDDCLAELIDRIHALPPLAARATTGAVLEKLVSLAPPDDDVCVLAVSLTSSE